MPYLPSKATKAPIVFLSFRFKPLKPFIFPFSLPGVVNSKQMKTNP
jgi:hypothetical protein